MDRARIIDEIRRRLEEDPGDVIAAWVFGSVARGEARATSDVDLALLTERERPKTLDAISLDLRAELSQRLGRPVDIVLMRSAPADLVHRVMRDGVLVLDRDESGRIAFEVAARNRYFDMAPIWRQYRSARNGT